MCDDCLRAIRPHDRKIETYQPPPHRVNTRTPAFDPRALYRALADTEKK